jgi:ATP-dependent helicase/nuclease subunit A
MSPAEPHPQTRASDPAVSAFVSANAGSGKTRTLVDRVARLLLRGAEPATLLCVTYTKAAAAEMQRRLFDRLGEWAVKADDALAADLAQLEARTTDHYDHARLSRARELFARALETPGGLKIQTIHAFCEKLLRRFPLEAGVSPGFEVADDPAAAELAAEARAAVARQAIYGGGAVAQAYERFSVALAFEDFEALFREFEYKRGEIGRWIGAIGGAGALPAAVAAIVGLPDLGDADEIERQAIYECDPQAWADAAEALLQGGSTDRDRARLMAGAAQAMLAGEFPIALVREALFRADGQPRSRLATKGIDPLTTFWLTSEQERLDAMFERARAARIANDTVQAMSLAAAYVHHFEEAKRRHSLLDFTDLIARTRSLLRERADAAWVLYKLDEGIDHILVDEAQDTAPEQWEVVSALTDEFFAGEGAEDGKPRARTVFVVGDEKQSIYSFQGAAPERLVAEQILYRQRVKGAGYRWEDVELHESWRSTPEVLGFVDAVFAPPELSAGLLPRVDGAEARTIEHLARRLQDPGSVDLWPLEREEPAEAQDAWTDPVDAPSLGAWRRLADRIAGEIARLVAAGEQVHDARSNSWRPATPGDVIVLVRKRGPLFEEVLRALRRKGVPAAGADRLRLSEHPVFQDTIALLRFILFPDDDLTVAGLLRSPFCEVDETSLFDLAWNRGRESLWRVLERRAGERPEWASAHGFLIRACEEARARTPFAFLSRLFAGLDAQGLSMRARFVTRLGSEAADALEEVLAQAMAAEQRGVRDLERLAHALGRIDVEVKREMDEPKGEVRVMTAHGAKGLEAPIVFLPETVGERGPRDSTLMEIPGGGFLWCASGKADCVASREIREHRKRKAEDEALRLLYVALTRARDRVVIGGRARQPPKSKAEELKGWYPLIEAAFARPEVAARVRPLVLGGMQIRRFGHDPATGGAAEAAPALASALPVWASQAPPADPRALRWTSPSEMADRARVSAPSPLEAAGGLGRFRRGELIHKLFEMLPDVPDSERASVAGAYLDGQPDLDEAQRAEIAASVFAVLTDTRFAEVFGPGSRAEVALAGRADALPDGIAISGRLDRLVVTPERVLVVDYKTNRPAPARVEDADPAYIAQMAAYAAVLRALYPHHRVEAALLWTDGPRLTPLADDLLSAALERLAGS